MGVNIPTSDITAKVLVVDDERPLADLFDEWVREKWTCETVYSGTEALDVVNEDVGLVLLDRQMPGKSGEEVLDELRNMDYSLQVMMVSGVEPDVDLVELPIDDYLQKPVDRVLLQEKIEELLLRRMYLPAVEKYFVCRAKLDVLENVKPPTELAESDEYLALKRQADKLRQAADATLGHMSDHVKEFHIGKADD